MSQVKGLLDHLNSGNLKNDEHYRRYYFSAISMLAYRDPDKCKQYWDRLGYKATFLDHDGAQCYVLEHDDHIVVAFRGTEPKQASDIKADLSFRKTWHKGYGKVHRGFMIEVWKLADDLTTHVYQTKKQVYVCGHSLGGAMATLAASRCTTRNLEEVFTYGAPRVGNGRFARSLRYTNTRIQNNNDIICRVPSKLFGYRHYSGPTYINHYGNIRKLTRWQKLKDMFRGRWAAIKKFQFFDLSNHQYLDLQQ